METRVSLKYFVNGCRYTMVVDTHSHTHSNSSRLNAVTYFCKKLLLRCLSSECAFPSDQLLDDSKTFLTPDFH